MGAQKGNLLGHPHFPGVVCPGSQRVVPPAPDLLNPQGWMNIEFYCAVRPTASPSLGEEQARTLPMSLMTPVINVFPKESLFPLPFAFPLQLATCHHREKQHRQQHTEAAQSLWQITAEATQPRDASQLCHLQTKATRKTITEIFPFHFWVCPGHCRLFMDSHRLFSPLSATGLIFLS